MVCPSLPSHVFGYAMDDEKRDILLFVSGMWNFVNGYSLFGHDKAASPIGDESLAQLIKPFVVFHQTREWAH